MSDIEQRVVINRQREAILRFYAAMTTADYDEIVNEYLGKAHDPYAIHTNRLFTAIEMAINYMNEQPQTPTNEEGN